ncbi:SAM-dependent methyltransferase [Rubritalea marina]|uniref:SAM-dependent methyltransferase n=1 Tax=Rubritalea marina TaxID=361055 RepID=UPI0012EA43A5|nr:SAM-dependent methyltransferase [Rubritalea marina]
MKQRFDEFMQFALHDPDHGYYARKIRTVGHQGDFSTTATLSPTLGKAIAARASEWLKHNPGSFHLIEIGAGDGSLAKAVIEHCPLIQRLKLHYHIVETSEPLTTQQEIKLKRHRVTWHKHPSEALKACNGRAIIFSNELVDAFPVRIFQRHGHSFEELHWDGNCELFECSTSLPDSSALNLKHPEKHRVEIHQSYREWLEQWISGWREGEMITIDYGDRYPELYHRRPHGTIRAFRLHENLTGPEVYQNVGHQDLTADVNFSDLIDWGDAIGLETCLFCTQHDFLKPHARGTTQDLYLLHPDGPGSAFKVLIQQPRF